MKKNESAIMRTGYKALEIWGVNFKYNSADAYLFGINCSDGIQLSIHSAFLTSLHAWSSSRAVADTCFYDNHLCFPEVKGHERAC